MMDRIMHHRFKAHVVEYIRIFFAQNLREPEFDELRETFKGVGCDVSTLSQALKVFREES